MTHVDYRVTIGRWSIDSAEDARTELIALDSVSTLNAAADRCELAVFSPPPKKSGVVEGVTGAVTGLATDLGNGGTDTSSFAVQVRGNEVRHSDQLTVELTAGDRSGKVATGDVHSFESSLGQTRIRGVTGKARLARTRVNQIYQNQSLGQIVEDLAGQASVSIGKVESGSTYSNLVVHESRNVLTHMCDLARREGMDVYFDPENKLNVAPFTKSKADHTFTYAADILDLVLRHCEPAVDHVMVYGESPASSQGASTWYWLAKDLKSFRGDLGKGNRLVTVSDRGIRTKDAADSQAKAKKGAIADQATTGRLVILGNPNVRLADAIEVKNAPRPELNGLFKVTSVRHHLSKAEGYLTHIGFTGQGGAKEANGPIGQAASAAGALGP